ncbi:MAG: radical SAM protein, partial [Oscillospiraceae bacterium]|nr:radical SAM protein [Oscillospiraceae bacterium]
ADLAFYGGSFTAIPADEQEMLLEAAQPFLALNPDNALRLSTRPDAVDGAVMERLRKYGVRTVELGVQSMDEEVLRLSGRGHTAADAERAARLVKASGFELILQMMTGLPGDTPERTAETARRIIALRPDGVRIYPTVIVRDTALFEMWRRGEYKEHTVEDAVNICSKILPMFADAGIPVIRLGLNPTDELTGGGAVAGAYHPALGELVYQRVYLEKARELLRGTEAETVTLGVARGCVSLMTGQHRKNIAALTSEFGLKSVKVRESDCRRGEIIILSIEKAEK